MHGKVLRWVATRQQFLGNVLDIEVDQSVSMFSSVEFFPIPFYLSNSPIFKKPVRLLSKYLHNKEPTSWSFSNDKVADRETDRDRHLRWSWSFITTTLSIIETGPLISQGRFKVS